MDTAQVTQLFLDSRRLSGRSKATISLYSLVLRRFSDWYDTLPSEPEPIEVWLAAINGQPETRHMYFRTLRTFYRWLELRHKVSNPMRYVEAPTVLRKLPRYLTTRELGSLLEFPSHSTRDKALLYFLADTGVRAGEAASLSCENIFDGWGIVTGKSGQRFIPLSPITQAMLANVVPKTGPVWQGSRGPLSSGGIQKLVKRRMKAAGLRGKKLGPHLLRHTFATLWTGEEIVLQNVMGHSTLHMTTRYRQLRHSHVRSQHEAHSPLKEIGRVAIIKVHVYLRPGRLAQLVRALALHARGQRFESSIAHHIFSYKTGLSHHSLSHRYTSTVPIGP